MIKGGGITFHKNCGDVETMDIINWFDVLYSSAYFCHWSGVDFLSRGRFEVSRDRCETRNLVHEGNVSKQGEILVDLEDLG